ncbi:MAG: acyl-CoA dehydrogenase family protein [Acidimicrobiales bacterium]
MNSPLHTPERIALVEKVAELGPRIAARSDELDRSAAFPFANWEDLKAAGLLSVAIPKEAGGLGGDFVGYALVSEELARHDASTALTFNMHVATTLLVGQIGDLVGLNAADQAFLDARRAILWQGVVEDKHIHSQPFSEGIMVGATSGYATRAKPVDGGFLVTGKKIFASLAGAADYHNVLCQVEGDDRLRLLGCPTQERASKSSAIGTRLACAAPIHATSS